VKPGSSAPRPFIYRQRWAGPAERSLRAARRDKRTRSCKPRPSLRAGARGPAPRPLAEREPAGGLGLVDPGAALSHKSEGGGCLRAAGWERPRRFESLRCGRPRGNLPRGAGRSAHPLLQKALPAGLPPWLREAEVPLGRAAAADGQFPSPVPASPAAAGLLCHAADPPPGTPRPPAAGPAAVGQPSRHSWKPWAQGVRAGWCAWVPQVSHDAISSPSASPPRTHLGREHQAKEKEKPTRTVATPKPSSTGLHSRLLITEEIIHMQNYSVY